MSDGVLHEHFQLRCVQTERKANFGGATAFKVKGKTCFGVIS